MEEREVIASFDDTLTYDGWSRNTGTNSIYRVRTPEGELAALKVGPLNREGLLNESHWLPEFEREKENLWRFPRIMKRYNLEFDIDPEKGHAILREWIEGETLQDGPTDSQIYNQILEILSDYGNLPRDLKAEQFVLNDGRVYLLDLGEMPSPNERRNLVRGLERVKGMRYRTSVSNKKKEGKSPFRSHLETMLTTGVADRLDTSILQPELSEQKNRERTEMETQNIGWM